MTSTTGNLKFVSLADSVFESIEGNILSGKYKKGETFTESKLSELFGVDENGFVKSTFSNGEADFSLMPSSIRNKISAVTDSADDMGRTA